jgi:multicomponent Na+:H+ antiporter subunit D
MLIAMAVMAAGCIGIGIFPQIFYKILPYPVDYQPYTVTHVITQYQLLLYSALAFTFLKVTKIYPPELRSVNLDFDFTYRRVLPAVVGAAMRVGGRVADGLGQITRGIGGAVYRQIYRLHGPEGVFARTWPTGLIAFWAVFTLWGFLLLYFWNR